MNWRQKHKDNGLCYDCGKASPLAGEGRCPACKERYTTSCRQRTSETKEKTRQTNAVWREQNRDMVRQNAKRSREKVRRETLHHYGGVCACCGESTLAFLTLDHVDGNGNIHRRALFGENISGHVFYRKMQQLGYPDGLQVLCWNCNMAKAHYGICPHQQPSSK